MNIAVAQSGGPTCAINASLAGVFSAGKKSGKFEKIYGAFNGIEGILENRLVDLSEVITDDEKYQLLLRTPSAVLGSCRRKLPDHHESSEIYEKITDVLHNNNIGVFFYIGGNDSMDTVAKYSSYLEENSINDIKVIGIPKTIDNDLCETDHSPGFGSAAKYVCSTVQEITRDSNVYCIPSVTIIEAMGRHAGWLAASSCCIRANGENAPHLIYLPEMTFSIEKFLSDVKNEMKKHKAVIVVVSEGVKTAEGKFAAEEFQSGQKDVFGHSYLAGIGKFLEKLVAAEIGCKVRSIELNVMQRCSSHIASREDIESSAAIGAAAVEAAISGKSGCMMTFIRESDKPYRFRIETADASKAANSEKLFPRKWINEEGNNVLPAALDYFMPLIQGEILPIMKNGMPLHMTIE
ncbi:MAG: 6-phosphofructokinase [Ruminococcus flavefaciens]|nr:6-phosphofructokinase [Ruminococcus flavefaciens]MCM1362357.1 6-phosphofructokinase [Clostridiales bacterium]MCM1434417.1 6-phosphofructokinase [Ruminococcus flavefaciens]